MCQLVGQVRFRIACRNSHPGLRAVSTIIQEDEAIRVVWNAWVRLHHAVIHNVNPVPPPVQSPEIDGITLAEYIAGQQ